MYSIQRESLFRSIYDGIWDTFEQSIDNKAE